MSEITLSGAVRQLLQNVGLFPDSTAPGTYQRVAFDEAKLSRYTAFLEEFARLIPARLLTDRTAIEHDASRFGDVEAYTKANFENDSERLDFFHAQLVALAQATQPDDLLHYDREHFRLAFYAYAVLHNDLGANVKLLQQAKNLFAEAVTAFWTDHTKLGNRFTAARLERGQWTRLTPMLKEALAAELEITPEIWDACLKSENELSIQQRAARLLSEMSIKTELGAPDYAQALGMETLPNGALAMVKTPLFDTDPAHVKTQRYSPRVTPKTHPRMGLFHPLAGHKLFSLGGSLVRTLARVR